MGFQFSEIWDRVDMNCCGAKGQNCQPLLLSWRSWKPCIVSLMALCLLGFQILLLCSKTANQISLGMVNLCRAIRLDSSTRTSTLYAHMSGTKWDLFSHRFGLVSVEESLEVQGPQRQDVRNSKPGKCSQGQWFWDSVLNGADWIMYI